MNTPLDSLKLDLHTLEKAMDRTLDIDPDYAILRKKRNEWKRAVKKL